MFPSSASCSASCSASSSISDLSSSSDALQGKGGNTSCSAKIGSDRPPKIGSDRSPKIVAKLKNKVEEGFSPVTYLQSLFATSEKGRKLLMRPNLSPFMMPDSEFIDAYDMEAVKAIRCGDVVNLRRMLDEGQSFNACNKFGESLIHMACRRGGLDVVYFLMNDAQVNIDVRDDFGRTPLHDACWTTKPNFDLMDLLLKQAPPDLLVVQDIRGHTPFHYARREHWSEWIVFFQGREELLLRRLSFC
jgi:hypothetical protein